MSAHLIKITRYLMLHKNMKEKNFINFKALFLIITVSLESREINFKKFNLFQMNFRNFNLYDQLKNG